MRLDSERSVEESRIEIEHALETLAVEKEKQITVHSVAWGLAFNLAACLLVALFTRAGEEREAGDALHGVFRRDHAVQFGGPAARSAKWSLALFWAFFALGPGTILGNDFFSRPPSVARIWRSAYPRSGPGR